MCWADGGRKRWIPIKQMDLARVALTVLYLSCCSAPSSGGGLQDMKNLVKMKMESGEAAGPPLRRLNLVSGCYSYHVTWKNYQRSRSTALYEPESVSMCHVTPRFFEKINVKQKDCFFLFLFSPFSFFFLFYLVVYSSSGLLHNVPNFLVSTVSSVYKSNEILI